MALPTDALNEVSLNTPLASHPCGNTANSKYKPAYNLQTMGNNQKCIDLLFQEVNVFAKNGQSDKATRDHISNIIHNLYTRLIQIHSVAYIPVLIKLHLLIIGKYISEGHYTCASKEILSLYNSSNLYAAHNLGDILLSDSYKSNNFYLSTLKILAIQVIIKSKILDTYEHTLVEMLAYDNRYILNDPKLKIHLVNKLLLNLYSISKGNKALFGLKFLQYISQFNLKIESYIKNMDRIMFQKQIIAYYRKQKEGSKFLNIFYLRYSQYCKSMDKIMISELVKGKLQSSEQAPNMDTFLNTIESEYKPSSFSIDDIENITKNCITFLSNGKPKLQEKIKVIRKAWTILHVENPIFGVNQKKLFDLSLTVINSSTEPIDKSYIDLLRLLRDVCITNEQYHRFLNLTNVIFNMSIITKDRACLLFAVKVDVQSMLSDKNEMNPGYSNTIKKFHKFLQCIPDFITRYDVFRQFYNIFAVFDIKTLAELSSYANLCTSVSRKWISKVFQNDTSMMSEVMTAFFVHESNNENIGKAWNPLTSMMRGVISDSFSYQIDRETTPNKYHFLTKYDALIKSMYFINDAIAKKSSKNLPQLMDYYTTRWIGNTNITETVSGMEVSFLQQLFNNLLLINFDKMVIRLANLLRENNRYFKSLSIDITYASLRAHVKLKYMKKVNETKVKILKIVPDFKTADIKSILLITNMLLTVCSGQNDIDLFRKIFEDETLKERKELFSIDNVCKLPIETYIQIILFNIKLHLTASQLQCHDGDLVSAVVECKRGLKLNMSLLKSKGLLGKEVKPILIEEIATSYGILLRLSIQMGLAKDSDYYANEITKFIAGVSEPSVTYSCLHDLLVYYKFTEQDRLSERTLQKANETFNHINSSEDILSLVSFMLDNGESDKLLKSLELSLDTVTSETQLPQHCELLIGRVLQGIESFPKEYRMMNQTNLINQQYNRLMKQLETDPLLKNIHDASLAVPNIKQPHAESILTNKMIDYIDYSNGSPRSSNMTPKSKSMRQKFDKFAIIANLKHILDQIEKMTILDTSYILLSRFSDIYSECYSLLANITPSANTREHHALYLSDLKRSLPHQYERLLCRIDNTLYQQFKLLEFREPSVIEVSKYLKSEEENTQIRLNNDCRFRIITIDVCPLTGSLVLTRVDQATCQTQKITIPLRSVSFRDIDSVHLPYSKVMEELNSIISQSNQSVSRDVTSAIHTSEGRKEWWKTRYSLDKRLQDLLSSVEKTWFGGFSGFFSDTELNTANFKEFQKTFTTILHQNLPSRKQVGSPEKFLVVEEWILELFLQIDTANKEFLTMVEDLIYFILDIFSYHGEENAYDEIDISSLHFQIEEAIKKYHAKSGALRNKKFTHTFLIVGSRCHTFPWENLSFMRSLSMTRVPSMSLLRELLARNNMLPRLNIDIGSKISMVLNPNGDLHKTEDRFSSIFSNITSNCTNSRLLINERPSESDFLGMLQTSNMFLFVGHGGGEQFARNKEITKLNHISPSLLLGCSSAAMKASGGLEPSGVIYSHLLGGSNMVLGNLWDVTDKDIDKFTLCLLENIGLVTDITTEQRENEGMCEAIITAREVCNLKYLNGAAPVIYGLPAHFSSPVTRR